MKQISVRDLNRKTADVVDALERGETFEIHRKGRAVGYLTKTPPMVQHKADWNTHFEWLKRQSAKHDSRLLKEFNKSRRQLSAREKSLEKLR
jgi:antitoxin (DNA-binding transcriptional repressor) of toxin-antitoxin stability system